MKRMIVAAFLAVLLVSPVLLLAMADGNVDEGKALFAKRCKMCHGADGQGNPAMARMLKVEFKSLDSEYIQEKSLDEVTEIVMKGKGKMAAVRGVSEGDVADIWAYIQTMDEDSSE